MSPLALSRVVINAIDVGSGVLFVVVAAVGDCIDVGVIFDIDTKLTMLWNLLWPQKVL